VTRRILRLAGALLIVAAVLIVADVAWQVWGTGWQQAQAQAHLRARIDPDLITAKPAHDSTVSGSSTTTTGAAVVSPPALGAPLGLLAVPAIGLSQVIVEGTGEAQLATGPGHYQGTAMPGQVGNMAVAGHRTTYGHPFYNLNELVAGDRITITTPSGVYTYSVTGQQIVSPSDVAILDSTGGATLTLTTCNPRYSAAQRLVVTATLVPA
jgi:sortase A